MRGRLAQRVPELIEEFDLTSLEVDAKEAFVLSRIDGQASVQELVDVSSNSLQDVAEILARLILEGAVRWKKATPASKRPTATFSQKPIKGIDSDDDIELDVSLRKEIDDLFGRLDNFTHYSVLGVSAKAERSEIRSAYFTLSKKFHPDTLYGKKLGSYQAKMEAIFQRITDAYEIVGKKKKRAQYDDYLRSKNRLTEMCQEIAKGNEEAALVMRDAQLGKAQTSKLPEAQSTFPQNLDQEWIQSLSPSSKGLSQEWSESQNSPSKDLSQEWSQAPQPTVPRKSQPADRLTRKREMWRKRLQPMTPSKRKSKRPSDAASSPPGSSARPARVPVGREQALRHLTASLRETAGVTGGLQDAERHLEAARAAEAAGSITRANNALRMAVAIAPERTDIAAEYRRIHGLLQGELSNMLETQAKYEEENKDWIAAAVSWAHLAEGRPDDPVPHRKAAIALWRANGDLKTARNLAQRSLELDPENVESRVILGRIYIRAEMFNSAQKILEEAAKLDPKREIVNTLLKEVEESQSA